MAPRGLNRCRPRTDRRSGLAGDGQPNHRQWLRASQSTRSSHRAVAGSSPATFDWIPTFEFVVGLEDRICEADELVDKVGELGGRAVFEQLIASPGGPSCLTDLAVAGQRARERPDLDRSVLSDALQGM